MTANIGKTSNWGKMRPETMRIWLDAICDGQPVRKNVMAWLCGIIRTADNIPDREKGDVTKWLVANGYTVKNLKEVYTVQYTHEECAAAIGCAVRESKRQREWLIDSNVLITVQPGRKGYPGLFIIAPVSVSSNVTECKRNRVSCASGFGDIDHEIGCHAQRADLQDTSLSRVIQSYPEKEPKEWTCVRCGSHGFDLVNNGTQALCRECELVHPVA